MAKSDYTMSRTVRVKGPLPDPLPRVSAKGLIGGAIVLQEGSTQHPTLGLPAEVGHPNLQADVLKQAPPSGATLVPSTGHLDMSTLRVLTRVNKD